MFIGICHHDGGWNLTKILIDSLKRSECTHNHYVWVNTHGESDTHKEYVLDHLPNSEFHSINEPQIKCKPVNSAWKYLAELAKYREEDWMFLDNDMVFFAKNAIDILYDEFLQKNCRMCGVLHHDPQGIYETLPPVIRDRAGGLYSVGVAFYDRDIIDLCPSIYGCPKDVPYDIWCKDHLLANFSACAYGQHRKCHSLQDLSILDPSQFYHHGCKDESLWELVLSTDYWAEVPELIAPPETY
jgi:hypothetical protein